jgi:hypothetical protein
VYENLGDYSQALNSFREALVLLKEAGDTEGEQAARQSIESVEQKQSQQTR